MITEALEPAKWSKKDGKANRLSELNPGLHLHEPIQTAAEIVGQRAHFACFRIGQVPLAIEIPKVKPMSKMLRLQVQPQVCRAETASVKGEPAGCKAQNSPIFARCIGQS